MKTMPSLSAASCEIPLRAAAAARRTTPAPQSTRYARLPATIAVAGPERSGSAFGVPVPRSTRRESGISGGVSPRAIAAAASSAAKASDSARNVRERVDGPVLEMSFQVEVHTGPELLWRSQEGPLLRVAPNEAGKTLKNPV